MTYTREQIIQALAVIKITCDECLDCKLCPFSKGDSKCYINNDREIYPNEWDIIDDKNWKAFY